jgi:pimeloyl-ACP methyl ester carboxylesterase
MPQQELGGAIGTGQQPGPRRRPTVLVAAVAAALGLLAAGCGSVATHPGGEAAASSSTTTAPGGNGSSTTAGGAFRPEPVSWHACTAGEGPVQAGYQCASVAVPLDPSQPHGRTIDIGLDRHQATGAKQGSLIVNPGGPGESAVDQLPDLVKMLGVDLQTHFDVVGYDPPGVGHSAPITCLDQSAYAQYLHEDPAPPGPGGFPLAENEDKAFAQACEQRSGALLPHVSTVDAARDMEYVREALGDGKLNYLGFSYGTFLGATYAGMYGQNIRSMVLDGAIDPSVAITPFLMEQAQSLDSEFGQFARACETNPSCAWHQGGGSGGDLVAAFQQLLTRVRQNPIPVGDRSVGPAELLYGTVAGLYSTQSWPFIYQALAGAEAGDGSLILQAFDDYVGRQPDGTIDNSLEAENAVNCLDDPAPTAAQLQSDLPSFTAAAPVFGPSVVYGELSCSEWPVPATGSPHTIAAPNAPTIVVVGSTGDPVTPYAGAQHLAQQLTHGVLLTRDGVGHTGYGASTCIQQHVDSYLLTLQAPPPGTTCPSDNTGS